MNVNAYYQELMLRKATVKSQAEGDEFDYPGQRADLVYLLGVIELEVSCVSRMINSLNHAKFEDIGD
jgi:hypothetical protein